MNPNLPPETSKLKMVNDVPIPSSSKPAPTKRDSSNGDLAKMPVKVHDVDLKKTWRKPANPVPTISYISKGSTPEVSKEKLAPKVPIPRYMPRIISPILTVGPTGPKASVEDMREFVIPKAVITSSSSRSMPMANLSRKPYSKMNIGPAVFTRGMNSANVDRSNTEKVPTIPKPRAIGPAVFSRGMNSANVDRSNTEKVPTIPKPRAIGPAVFSRGMNSANVDRSHTAKASVPRKGRLEAPDAILTSSSSHSMPKTKPTANSVHTPILETSSSTITPGTKISTPKMGSFKVPDPVIPTSPSHTMTNKKSTMNVPIPKMKIAQHPLTLTSSGITAVKNLSGSKHATTSPNNDRIPSSLELPTLSGPPLMPKEASVTKDPLGEERLCSIKACGKVFKASRFYKTCEECRARSRKYNDRRKEREHAARDRQAVLKRSWDALPKEERFAGFMQQLRKNGILSSRDANVSSSSKNRKAEDDVEGAEPLKTPKVRGEPDEYQHAEELYAAVRRVVSQKGVAQCFTGYFCVVGSAQTVINGNRVRSEALRLMESAGVVTRLDKTPVKTVLRDEKGPSGICVTYQCMCAKRCEGNVAVSMESVESRFTVGDKVTVKITH